jgi:hypothetical protein
LCCTQKKGGPDRARDNVLEYENILILSEHNLPDSALYDGGAFFEGTDCGGDSRKTDLDLEDSVLLHLSFHVAHRAIMMIGNDIVDFIE